MYLMLGWWCVRRLVGVHAGVGAFVVVLDGVGAGVGGGILVLVPVAGGVGPFVVLFGAGVVLMCSLYSLAVVLVPVRRCAR